MCYPSCATRESAILEADCQGPPPIGDTEILLGSWPDQPYPESTQATYKCHPGYRTLGTIKRVCRNGEWVALNPARICQRKPCGHPGDTPFGSFHLEVGNKFEYAKVVYKCDEVYVVNIEKVYNSNTKEELYRMLSENNFCECKAEGWTNDIPIWKVVKCLPVTEPENGRIISSSIEPDEEYNSGQVVQFECNSGFKHEGHRIYCSENGHWSNEKPRCVEIRNGHSVSLKKIYKENEIFQYKCNQGFENSESNATCTSSGWSPSPSCEEVTCNPPYIPNGVYSPQRIKHRTEDEIRYECKSGFYPAIRGNTTKCTSCGWIPPPRCNCTDFLNETPKAHKTGSDGPVFGGRDKARSPEPALSAHGGPWSVRLRRPTRGRAFRGPSSSWDLEAPAGLHGVRRPPNFSRCHARRHPKAPRPRPRWRLQLGRAGLNQEAAPPSGHPSWVAGSPVLHSQGQTGGTGSRSWGAAGEAASCPGAPSSSARLGPGTPESPGGRPHSHFSPPQINIFKRQCIFNYVENGYYPRGTRHLLHESVKVDCYPDHSLSNGQNTATCTENGWSPPLKCIRINLGSNRRTSVCHKQLSELTRPSASTQVEDAPWARVLRHTEAAGWREPQRLDLVLETVSTNSPRPRAEAALRLPPAWPGAKGERQGGEGSGGRRGRGRQSRAAEARAAWAAAGGGLGSGRGRPGQPFVPRGALAPQPGPPPMLWGSSLKVNLTDPAPAPAGGPLAPSSALRVFLQNLSCSQPPDIDHGRISPSKSSEERKEAIESRQYAHGIKLNYSCEDGFITSEEGLPCEPLPSIPNGVVSHELDSYPYGQEVIYNSFEGFGIDGPAFIKCLGGKWSSPPECISIVTDCFNLPNFDDAMLLGERKESYKSGDQVTYRCPKFYQVDGSNTITYINGKWIGKPMCKHISCVNPPKVENANITSKQMLKYPSVREYGYECIKPFEIFGEVEVMCLNGIWTEPPKCKDSTGKCGPPPPIDNGDLTSFPLAVYPMGSSVEYQCQSLYQVEVFWKWKNHLREPNQAATSVELGRNSSKHPEYRS
ncbi:LOW QUALITY PROTEIN: complement factor H-like [Callospermophilus lateralis]